MRKTGEYDFGARAHNSVIMSIHWSSSIILMPRSAAFFALDPAPGPAISKSVLAETEPDTLAPRLSARALALVRLIRSRVLCKDQRLARNRAAVGFWFFSVLDRQMRHQSINAIAFRPWRKGQQ